eukprot:Phypoly_transcript_17545.p1 GENE.Phypoly_transcript_17545~~Phypoly_transcript_17545.p1  ORF type:complete len:202 (+),score=27.20 Phypoly_transcript_17545:160-765(+)
MLPTRGCAASSATFRLSCVFMQKLEHNGFIVEEVDPKERIRDIGRLRYDVWEEMGEIDKELFPDGVWQDKYDNVSRHWVAYKKDDTSKKLVACARLTVHPTLEESVDGYVWQKFGLHLVGSVSNISKLVVHKSARRFGLASIFNQIRIDAAKEMGAACVTSTASDINAKLLVDKFNFRDTGFLINFPNRPNVPFHLVELIF